MSQGKRKVTLYIEERSCDLLVIGTDTRSINYSLRQFANLIGQTTNKMANVLTPADWEYLAHCLAGLDWQISLPAGNLADVMRAEVAEEARLADIGPTVWPVDPKGNHCLLVQALRKVTELEAYAILLAVRHYWRTGGIDGRSEAWWEPAHRLRPSVKARRIVHEGE